MLFSWNWSTKRFWCDKYTCKKAFSFRKKGSMWIYDSTFDSKCPSILLNRLKSKPQVSTLADLHVNCQPSSQHTLSLRSNYRQYLDVSVPLIGILSHFEILLIFSLENTRIKITYLSRIPLCSDMFMFSYVDTALSCGGITIGDRKFRSLIFFAFAQKGSLKAPK